MDKEIKKLADSGDLKSLKYIFVDALDVDPTFVRYEKEYNYCKSIPGLLEQHMELTPFVMDPEQWTESYWTKLKMDLVKNFSDRRMAHMRDVAKVFLAEKVRRILAERAVGATAPTTARNTVNVIKPESASAPVRQKQAQSQSEKQEMEMLEERRKLELEKKKMEAEEQAEKERRERRRQSCQNLNQDKPDGAGSKKLIGIVIAAVAVIVVVLMLLLK